MEEAVPVQPKRKTSADYKAAIEALLAEMDHLDEQMNKDRAKSERLKVETQIIKAETELIKERIEATSVSLREQINHLTGTV